MQTPVISRDRLVCDKFGIHMKTMWKNEQNYETFSDITNPRQDRSGVDKNLRQNRTYKEDFRVNLRCTNNRSMTVNTEWCQSCHLSKIKMSSRQIKKAQEKLTYFQLLLKVLYLQCVSHLNVSKVLGKVLHYSF